MRSDWICGTMISSMSFNDAYVTKMLSENFFGKLYLVILRSVFPPYMTYIGCLYAALSNYNYGHNN